ncbi:MAG: signal peptidase II [Candidatus Brocadiia bacterium]|nr:MAG: signal peptidase II [Candidatus Brocadiia bacterium]
MMKNNKADNARPASRAFSYDSQRKRVPCLKVHLVFWAIVIAGVGLDLWTKNAVFNWLSEGYSYTVIDGCLDIVRLENPGAAFGMAAGKTKMLIFVSVFALIAVLAVFFISGRDRIITHIGYAFFVAGIFGNLYDRLFNDGMVRDFIDVYCGEKHWPAFNVADSMLCIAVGLLLLSTLLSEMPGLKRDQQQK